MICGSIATQVRLSGEVRT